MYITNFERQVDGEWDKYPTSITTPYNSMKSARVKDINRPVNEGNVDKDQLVRYSNGNSYLYIIRPLVLTETEKANVAKNDTVGKLAKYEWDQTDNYAALYFGDGTGSYNDYGQTIYLQDKIHVPEVYPAPSFKENSVFIEIKQGITTMWERLTRIIYRIFIKHTLTRQGKINLQRGRNQCLETSGRQVAGIRAWKKIGLYL